MQCDNFQMAAKAHAYLMLEDGWRHSVPSSAQERDPCPLCNSLSIGTPAPAPAQHIEGHEVTLVLGCCGRVIGRDCLALEIYPPKDGHPPKVGRERCPFCKEVYFAVLRNPAELNMTLEGIYEAARGFDAMAEKGMSRQGITRMPDEFDIDEGLVRESCHTSGSRSEISPETSEWDFCPSSSIGSGNLASAEQARWSEQVTAQGSNPPQAGPYEMVAPSGLNQPTIGSSRSEELGSSQRQGLATLANPTMGATHSDEDAHGEDVTQEE